MTLARRQATTSHAVPFPFGVFPVAASYLPPRGYQPLGYGAFSAFRTLSRPSSAHHLPALFHAGPALGVYPSGSFAIRGAIDSFEPLALLWLAYWSHTAFVVAAFRQNT
jgi:hypothetical protein